MKQNSGATTIKKTFSRTTTVKTLIQSDTSTVWSLLTDSQNFPKWNSTIISLQGDIRKGEKIQLKSTLDASRTFKLKVKELIPNETMTWGDAMGTRVYNLSDTDNGVLFEMTEKIGGFMFPLFASKIPSFEASFEKFSQDLKKEAESIYNSK